MILITSNFEIHGGYDSEGLKMGLLKQTSVIYFIMQSSQQYYKIDTNIIFI